MILRNIIDNDSQQLTKILVSKKSKKALSGAARRTLLPPKLGVRSHPSPPILSNDNRLKKERRCAEYHLLRNQSTL